MGDLEIRICFGIEDSRCSLNLIEMTDADGRWQMVDGRLKNKKGAKAPLGNGGKSWKFHSKRAQRTARVPMVMLLLDLDTESFSECWDIRWTVSPARHRERAENGAREMGCCRYGPIWERTQTGPDATLVAAMTPLKSCTQPPPHRPKTTSTTYEEVTSFTLCHCHCHPPHTRLSNRRSLIPSRS